MDDFPDPDPSNVAAPSVADIAAPQYAPAQADVLPNAEPIKDPMDPVDLSALGPIKDDTIPTVDEQGNVSDTTAWMSGLQQHDPTAYAAIKADPTGQVGLATILHDRQMQSQILNAAPGTNPLEDNFSVYQYAARRGILPPPPGILSVVGSAAGDLWNGAKGLVYDAGLAASGDSATVPVFAAGVKRALSDGAQLAAGTSDAIGKLAFSDPVAKALGNMTPEQAQTERERGDWGLYKVNASLARSTVATQQNLQQITQLPPEDLENAVNGLSQVLNPANLIPAHEAFGAVAGAFKIADRSLPGVTEGLATIVREKASTSAAADAAFNAAALADPPLAEDVIKTAGDASKAAAADLAAATSAHATSLAADEAAQKTALQAPLIQRAAGKTMQAVGTAMQIPGKVVGAISDYADSVVAKAADGNPEAAALGNKVTGYVGGAAAAAVGGAVAGTAGHSWLAAASGALSIAGLDWTGADLNAAGKQLVMGRVGLNYFARVAKDTTFSGASRWVAGHVLDPLVPFAAPILDKAIAGLTGAASAAPIGAGFGFLQSGGTLAGAAAGAAGITPLGTIAGLAGSLHPGYAENQAQMTAEANRRYYASRIAGDPVSMTSFNARSLASQTELANWAHASPDFTLLDLRNQGHRDFISSAAGAGVEAPTGGGVTFKGADGHVYVAVDPTDPHASAILPHELRHVMQMSDPNLTQAVKDTLVGNVDNQTQGIHTKLGPDGEPIVVQGTDSKGNPMQSYATTDEYQALKKNYTDRVSAASGQPYSISDADFALEHDAEESARTWQQTDSFDQSIRPTVSGILASKFQDAPFLRTVLAKFGHSFSLDGEINTPSSAFKGIEATPETQKLVKAYTDAWARRSPDAEQPEAPSVDLSADAISKNPGLLELLDGSSDVARDPKTGKAVGIETDPVTGRKFVSDPSKLFKKASEINADNKAMSDAVTKAVADSAAANPGAGDPDAVGARVQDDGTKVIAGRYFTDDHLARIEASGAFDPSQLSKLKNLNALLKSGDSNFIRMFYQAALKGGKYASRSGHWVEEIPYGFKVTKADNITIQTAAPDKLARNLEKLWQNQKGPARGLWPSTAEMFKDADTYLRDLGAGKPGATTIGEAKRDAINAALGLKGPDRAKDNPVFDATPQKSLTPAIVSRRLDRTNRMQPGLRTDAPAFSSKTYDLAKENFTPGEPRLTPAEGEPTGSTNDNAGTAGAGGEEQGDADLLPSDGGGRFHDAIKAGAAAHPAGAAVTVKTADEYNAPGTKLFLAKDDSAGAAVTSDGDLISVFRKPGGVDIKGILDQAAPHATTLDAYTSGDGKLPKLYSQYGFEPIARTAWNPDYAPPNWPAHLGEPDVLFMAKTGADPIQSYDPESVPLVKDWDTGKAMQLEAAAKAKSDKITGTNAENAVPPSDDQIRDALSSDKKPFVGAARDLPAGTPVGLRIDIPAFQRTGKYVVTVHEGAGNGQVGKRIGYDGIAAVDNPVFSSNEKGSEKIRDGNAKFPVATVEGAFDPSREVPKDINSWTPVGFDPKEHSYFYDKATDEPVVSGSKAVSVGNSVFVKDPVYGSRANVRYTPGEVKDSPIENDDGTMFENTNITKDKTSLAKNVLDVSPSTAFSRLDAATAKIADDPSRLADPTGYAEYMKDAGVTGDIITAPPTLKTILENPEQYVANLQGGYHGALTKPGTLEAAKAGLDGTVAMRAAIGSRPPELVTAMHHLWGILSRMLPPIEQESMWLRLVSHPDVLNQMQRSIDGTYNLTQDQWAATVSRARAATAEVANGRGNQGTANANAFHMMLARWNGSWDKVSDVYAAKDSIESGRRFWDLGMGPVGIKNKVQRFIGLTFGTPGLIMDRWKYVEMYYPQFGKPSQEYFRYSATGTPEDPNGIYGAYGSLDGANPAFSLAYYEGMETALKSAIAKSPTLQGVLGDHANVGGMHWMGWNAIKNEAVGHSSLDLTYDLVKDTAQPTPEDVLNLLRKKQYYTEGLVGNSIQRFTLPLQK